MSYVNINTATAPPSSQEMLKQIHAAFGARANRFKAVANSTAALKSMWGSFGGLGSGTLGAKLDEQIAVTVAHRNRCEYCLAAHTVLGQNAGVSSPDMSAAQVGKSADPKTQVLSVSQWLNTEGTLTLEQLKGRVVVIGAFQMLCPGCVSHSIPQLKKLHELSKNLPLTVIGLHTVFEHHQAMQPHALKAFVHEYRLNFPVGVADYEGASLTPKTMQDWHIRGTPSTLVFSANGDLCLHQFGHIDDLPLGIFIGQLLASVDSSTQLAP